MEALLDMGNHVIADEGLGVVDWYSTKTLIKTK